MVSQALVLPMPDAVQPLAMVFQLGIADPLLVDPTTTWSGFIVTLDPGAVPPRVPVAVAAATVGSAAMNAAGAMICVETRPGEVGSQVPTRAVTVGSVTEQRVADIWSILVGSVVSC